MQCKDIPDAAILKFLARLERKEIVATFKANWPEAVDGVVTWYPTVGTTFNGCVQGVPHAMPEGTPEKLVLAKMRRLIKRGLVDGCGCGCRGDFELTDKGRAILSAAVASNL